MNILLFIDNFFVKLHRLLNPRKFAISFSIDGFTIKGIKMSLSIPSNVTNKTFIANSDAALNGGLVWASSDESVATVSAVADTLTAIVTRVSAGATTISAFDAADNLTGTIDLDFAAAPTEITITPV